MKNMKRMNSVSLVCVCRRLLDILEPFQVCPAPPGTAAAAAATSSRAIRHIPSSTSSNYSASISEHLHEIAQFRASNVPPSLGESMIATIKG